MGVTMVPVVIVLCALAFIGTTEVFEFEDDALIDDEFPGLDPVGCAKGWIGGYERNCFKIISTVETWDKADGTCKELGAKLVTLDTPQKTAFVVEALIKANLDDYGWWVGARRINNVFKWQGSADEWYGISYYNWHSGQPDNYLNHEDCMQIVGSGTAPLYRWNDNYCEVDMAFICETTY